MLNPTRPKVRLLAALSAAAALAAPVSASAAGAATGAANVPGQSSCVAFVVTHLPTADVVYVAQNTPALGENGKVFFAQQKTDGLC